MKLLRKVNVFLIVFPVLIIILGLITLFSTFPDLARTQASFFVLSILVYAFVSILDYGVFRYIWRYMYVGVLILLLVTPFLGSEAFGSVRWIYFRSFSIQPSEYAKIALILSLSSVLVSKKMWESKIKLLIYALLLVSPIIFFVFIQPDLGTAIVLLAAFVGTLFYSGLDRKYFLIGILLFGIFSSPMWNSLRDYQKQRILVFLNPTSDLLGSGYNVAQSVIAVGSGQILGRGIGRGTQSHLQFLPVYWTDFIFASFAEEWGFVGVFVMLVLYLSLFLSILYVTTKATDVFGRLICIGVFFVFFTQFTINVGMNLGVMPVTGIPLALVSYGGSSLLTSVFLLGLVQSVWIHRKA